MKKASLLLLIFLCACVHTPENPNRRMVRKCTPVLEEILRVQDLREKLNSEIHDHIIHYQAGGLDHEQYKRDIEEWLEHESALRSYVTRLYDNAYESRCL